MQGDAVSNIALGAKMTITYILRINTNIIIYYVANYTFHSFDNKEKKYAFKNFLVRYYNGTIQFNVFK